MLHSLAKIAKKSNATAKPMPDDLLEMRLLGELAAVERRIHELEQERVSLQRLITRVRRENLAARDVTRKNSIGRVLVENAIMQRLNEVPGRSARTSDLWRAARSTDLRLKESTFRSHIHRLKGRGLIESAGFGKWRSLEAPE